MSSTDKKESLNFIEQIIEEDLSKGKYEAGIQTRFPPEPNGYLHIGHVKAISISFELAKKYGGKTNLRFDDTNPATEKTEYVDNIIKDIKWLGYKWEGEPLFTSDYFDQLFDLAVLLINKGLAYVDDSSAEEMAEMKGDTTRPGVNSPYRERAVEENLSLFRAMKNGEFPDGAKVLRAKIDMSSPNLHMRDPVLYRIKRQYHHRTGDKWVIYPMYDFAHGQSDAIEHITHSLCSLEFRHHRPLYNWLIKQLEIFPSRQIEFARMNVEYMITSKRKLKTLVDEGYVSGWDDPRMPTISGMRRKGYPSAALRTFANKAGVAKRENLIEMDLLESCVRDELNKSAQRIMVVLDPIKLVLTNYPEGQVEMMPSDNNPEDAEAGQRMMPLSKYLLIEREDFMEDPPKKFFRLGPERTVRLKNGYIITCTDFIKDDNGQVTEVHVKYYPESRSGSDTSGIKAKGTLHWVSADQSVPIRVNMLDHLFKDQTPTQHEDKDYLEFYNEDSLVVNDVARAEPYILESTVDSFQFLRKGYFYREGMDGDVPDFNQTVSLKGAWKPKN
ncbi:UNVERIFIED_CONTAM: hypothetical protein GTU68_015246 [Idotea baltica]|nr:hypothetical protein [Idotea baltica]